MVESPAETITSPQGILDALMKEKGLSFDSVKNKLIKEGYENSESFANVGDIPKTKIFELIERIKKI